MILAALALSAASVTPDARLDAIADRLRDANPEWCRANACPSPVLGKTNRCGLAEGYRITIDRKCWSRLANEDEQAFLVAHEFGHVISGTRDEQGADFIAHALLTRAGFDATRGWQIFTTLKVRPRVARNGE